MAYIISGVSSSSPTLALRLAKSSVPPQRTKPMLSAQIFRVTCCFSNLSLSSTNNATPRIHFTTLHAKSSEQRSKLYTQRKSQQETQRSQIRSQSQQSRKYSSKLTAPRLERPEVIFSNNHLLVMNKSAGWKSQPGNGGGKNNSQISAGPDPKCLLTYLKSQSLGGGSMNDFLIPTHRLDQPCTGVLIFAKNGKAASRVQVAWAKRKVKKCYWVVVEGGSVGKGMDGLELLRSRSVYLNGSGNANTYQLSALLKSTGGKGGSARGGRSKNSGSVTVRPLPANDSSSDAPNNGNGRVCHIEWEHLLNLPVKASSPNTRHLLSVTTDTGAKHQVRALLAIAGGAPIAGDLRYGNNINSQFYNTRCEFRQGRVDKPLPDGSVALHARSVFLPTVSLGGLDFLAKKPFAASIPKRWRSFFGISEDDVRRL